MKREEEAARNMAAWLETTPPAVRMLAERYPPTSKYDADRWVLGYEEFKDGTLGLSLTRIPPSEAYDRYDEMVETREIVCSPCLE